MFFQKHSWIISWPGMEGVDTMDNLFKKSSATLAFSWCTSSILNSFGSSYIRAYEGVCQNSTQTSKGRKEFWYDIRALTVKVLTRRQKKKKENRPWTPSDSQKDRVCNSGLKSIYVPKIQRRKTNIKIFDHRSGQTKQILARNTDVEDNQDIICTV